jgi:CubicO group peptidase (beta-lactamase class C family)
VLTFVFSGRLISFEYMKKRLKFNLVLLLVIISSFVISTPTAASPRAQDDWPTENWRTSTPEAQGIDSRQLVTLFDFIETEDLDMDSILIIRNGYLVLEAYSHGNTAEMSHAVYSISKCVTGMLAGIAIDEGLITNVDQPVLDFYPDYTFENVDAAKLSIRIEDLLTMRAGLAWPDESQEMTYQMAYSRNWAQFVLDQPMEAEPGTVFNYNNGAAFLVMDILHMLTGDATTYAEEHLFGPLGITNYRWELSRSRVPNGSWGLHMLPRDMAKLGYLYLNEGMWDGQQIVPAEWVAISTQPHVDIAGLANSVSLPTDEAYGYYWWIYPSYGYYSAEGMNGQAIWIVAEHNLLVVFTADLASQPQLLLLKQMLDNIIIPAIESDDPLPTNPDALAELDARIESF